MSIRCPILIRLLGVLGACFTSLSVTMNMLVPTLNSRGTVPHPWAMSEVPGMMPLISE